MFPPLHIKGRINNAQHVSGSLVLSSKRCANNTDRVSRIVANSSLHRGYQGNILNFAMYYEGNWYDNQNLTPEKNRNLNSDLMALWRFMKNALAHRYSGNST